MLHSRIRPRLKLISLYGWNIPTSLLQISGLTSFSKKQKRERSENLQQILKLIKIKEVRVCPLVEELSQIKTTKTGTAFHLAEVPSSRKPQWILSFQRYLSLLITVLNFRDNFEDIHEIIICCS